MKILNLFIKLLLAPFSLLYGLLTAFHHHSYNKRWKKSIQFDTPTINIGNLNVGGTGKTPHTNHILQLLKEDYNIAVLSRGYGRRTKGYIEVTTNHKSIEVGDEPLMLKHKHPNNLIVVGEERILAIPQMIQEHQDIDAILLDDAYQHRRIKPSHQILLTAYDNLYIHDYPLPSGRLREPRWGANRADAVIVTKVPDQFKKQELHDLRKQLKLKEHQDIFYSKIKYGTPYQYHSEAIQAWDKSKSYHLICGIAQPQYIIDYLTSLDLDLDSTLLRDHAPFRKELLEKWEEQCKINKNLIIIVTEKDAMRLKGIIDNYKRLEKSILVLPIELEIGGKDKDFEEMLRNWIKK